MVCSRRLPGGSNPSSSYGRQTLMTRINYLFKILLEKDIAVFLYGKEDEGREEYHIVYS